MTPRTLRAAHAFERFDFAAPAGIFVRRGNTNRRAPLTYLRFDTAAEAISYVMDEVPSRFRASVIMEVAEQRFDQDAILALSAGHLGSPGRG